MKLTSCSIPEIINTFFSFFKWFDSNRFKPTKRIDADRTRVATISPEKKKHEDGAVPGEIEETTRKGHRNKEEIKKPLFWVVQSSTVYILLFFYVYINLQISPHIYDPFLINGLIFISCCELSNYEIY